MTFEDTRDLGVLSGRGPTPVGTKRVEEVATGMVERASTSIYPSASGLSVSRELEIPWFTVRKKYAIHFKSSRSQNTRDYLQLTWH
ncbi:hypothetical protein TNCV_3674471 [Trichonephila clavipes]|nr:hypothetical protein TNCV_3674471 [Trichonephila clavipes]